MLASAKRKLRLKRSNHVAEGLLLAFVRSGEEARLESPFSPSPCKSSEFSPPVVVEGPGRGFLADVCGAGGGFQGGEFVGHSAAHR